MTEIKIEERWKRALESEFEKPYFTELTQFVKNEILQGETTIYPYPKNLFAALKKTPFEKVRVVIL